MMNRKTLWLAIAATATVACSPVEYADELGRNKIKLEFPSTLSGTHKLTMSLESEDKPVLVTDISTDEVTDFRGPPGWYIGEVAGRISSNGSIDTMQAVFKYTENSITRASFGALGSIVHALNDCSSKDYSVKDSIDIVNSAFGVDPANQDEASSVKSDMKAINDGFQGYADELGLSYFGLMDTVIDDISTDCKLNGYSQNIATGARDHISYNGSTKTAIELANGISANINTVGLKSNHNVNHIVQAVQHSSSELFDDNVEVFDTEAAEIESTSDLSISLFGTKELSFSYTDTIGLDYLTARVQDVDLPVSYDKLNKAFSVTIDTTLFANETHTLTISSVDMAGNAGTHHFSVLIDNLGPSVTNTTKHYNVINAPLVLMVTPPTGSVTNVSIDGVEFNNSGNNVWEGNVSLAENVNELVVNATTSFGLSVQRSITVYFDNVEPVVSASSPFAPTANISGVDSGSMTLADVQNSNVYFDLRNIPHYELGQDLSISEMTDLGMLYLEVTSDDGYEGDANANISPEIHSTPVDHIELSVSLSVNGTIVAQYDIGQGEGIVPITFEFFGTQLTSLTSSDTVEVIFTATDLAGNSSTTTYSLPIFNESMTHTLIAGNNLQGSFTPMVYKDGLTTSLTPIPDQAWGANPSIELGIMYDHLAIDYSDLSYFDPVKGYYVEVQPNTVSMPIPMGSQDRDIRVDHGLSLYGAFLQADMALNGTNIDSSIATGDTAFRSAFEGLLTETPYESVDQITHYSAKANATILRDAFIRASNQYEASSNYECSAFDIEKLAAFDYADDFTTNKSANPIVDYCNDFSPYDAARLIANQEREIVHELGLLQQGNDFDLNIARSHYTPVGPIALSAFDVDVYSGNLAFTPVYRTETNTYSIDMFINNEYQSSYEQGEEIVIDTTAFPNGMYVVKLVMTDLYFNTTTDTFFSTFQN